MPSDLEEKEAIRELAAEYCFRLDEGHYSGVAALFTEDGVWETVFGKGEGRKGILDFMTRASRVPMSEPRMVHLIGNMVIKIDGDQAQMKSAWICAENSRRGPVVGAAGTYYDELRKQDGQWLFSHRRIDRYIADTRGPAHAG